MLNRKAQIAIILATTLSATSAFAWWGEGGNGRADGHHYEQGNCYGQKGHRMKGQFGRKHMAEWMDQEFTADEIRTLQSARLIMKGNPNLKIGDVKTLKDGYSVTIVTNDNSLVEELTLAKNGMQKDRYERAIKRMEERQKNQ